MCVCGVCTAVHTYTRRDAHMIETINVFIHTLSVGLEKMKFGLQYVVMCILLIVCERDTVWSCCREHVHLELVLP